MFLPGIALVPGGFLWLDRGGAQQKPRHMVAHSDHWRTVFVLTVPGLRDGRFRRSLDGRTIAVPPPRRAWLGGELSTNIRWPGSARAGPRVAAGRGPPRSLAVLAARCALAGFLPGEIGEAFAREPIDLASDQPLDFEDVFLIGGGDNRERDAGFARASGAADAMDIILGMGWDIEIEHMAYVWNVEAARRDVRADNKVDVAGLESIQGNHAGALIHVAVQDAGIEAMFLQGFMEERHVPLAIAKNDRVLEIGGAADQAA